MAISGRYEKGGKEDGYVTWISRSLATVWGRQSQDGVVVVAEAAPHRTRCPGFRAGSSRRGPQSPSVLKPLRAYSSGRDRWFACQVPRMGLGYLSTSPVIRGMNWPSSAPFSLVMSLLISARSERISR